MKKSLQFSSLLIISTILMSISVMPASAQILYPIGGDQYSSATSRLFNEAYNSSKDSSAVPVILTKVSRGRSIDTRPLVKAFPNHRIPTIAIPVALPDLSGYIDTVAVLWYLRNPMRPSVGVVNVMLIAQNQDQEYVYFVDSNNNGSFLDDGRPFQFKPKERQREVAIWDNRIGEVTLLLRSLTPESASVPSQAKRVEKKQKVAAEGKSMMAEKRFSLHFIGGLSSGSGDASIYFRVVDKPDSDEHNKSYHYTAKYFASLNTSLGLALSFRNLYIGGSGSYELSQVGEQNMTVKFDKNGTPTRQFLNNQGNWPYTRFNITGFTEYDISISDRLRLAPMVSYTKFNILTKQPFRLFGEAKLNDYFLDRYAYTYGGKFKYVLSERTMLFAELYRRVNHFDASSYFPDIEEGSFSMNLKQVYGGVGVQIRLLDI